MRLLTRRIGQSFAVNGVTITVKAIRGNRVRLTFDPPQGVLVSRGEIIEELSAAAEQALAGLPAQLHTPEGSATSEARGPRA